MPWVVWLLQVFLLSFVYVSESLRFHGSKAYAIYEKWDARTNGTLQFFFRTHKLNGMLFYIDDLGKQQFLDLSLVDGRVRIYLYFTKCYLKKKFIRGMFADSNWHKVTVRRNYEKTVVKVDNSSVTVTCEPLPAASDSPYFDATSFFYVGAIPSNVPLNSISNPGSYWESDNPEFRFEGCIMNITHSDGISSLKPAILQDTGGTSDTCNDICSEPAYNKCQHKTKCVDKITRIECNCFGSGYEGTYCTTEATSAFLNGSGYISYAFGTDNRFLTAFQSLIAFRFFTTSDNGIILHTSMETGFLAIEIMQRNIVIDINLGFGNLQLESIALKNFHWYAVEIKRNMRNITLLIDNVLMDSGVLLGNKDDRNKTDSSNLVYIGGAVDSEYINISRSKQNFTGYLQQFHFNNYNVLNKVEQGNDERFRKHGKILFGKLLNQLSLNKTAVHPTSALPRGTTVLSCLDDEDCTSAPTSTVIGQSPFSCPPGLTSCITGLASSTSPTSQVLPKEKETVGKEGSLLVPIWVVILVAILCFTALCVTAFLIVRWNKRYSGSFNPENMNLSQNHTDKQHNHETQTIEKCDPLYTKV